ncbi:glycine/D-amino acid oxidase-like deaminating enzyme [Bradyrhizobium sp. USDA 4532]|uniref:3-hydroxyacyl-CoA dehydrogenase NAD-binding domain-containing protein n=1 Tax=unclassified Bradyrhizobium TaxID=2631580 RepID=UPI00209FDCD6|nr:MULTISPECIES: 3-hydroxyacyl-CoA dehydrogenase NAD-binding domain-containing protein [unclassified Bradyrhizobium]MCP1835564.1 glycine/D-amino acid oxidase-like deaminating enzyme [Bradyrhizobium sp. USDA 4545]MCP1920313.1 glycine/D-amino acid oxidase-like deaminating enzyme [Bradyrhizobium sp. USDA 4532]
MSDVGTPGARKIAKVTCVGGGLIGSGWAAHFMRAGLDVVVHDEAAERESFLRENLANAMPVLDQNSAFRLTRSPHLFEWSYENMTVCIGRTPPSKNVFYAYCKYAAMGGKVLPDRRRIPSCRPAL